MSAQPRLHRHAACPCGSGRRLPACCLPWEEAFQRLVGHFLNFSTLPRIRQHEAAAAAVFWNTESAVRPGKGLGPEGGLRFLEWFLHDYCPWRGGGTLLAAFADAAVGLGPREEHLLLESLLAPVRAYEVTDTFPRVVVTDLLTGGQRAIWPLGLPGPRILSDILICRLFPLGRLTRPGASLLVLPGACREELLAYLRTAYRVVGPARHVSLEDFLDCATHLYHHFFLLRGRSQGGRGEETLPRTPFAPGRRRYQGKDLVRIRTGLDRQPELERQADIPEEVRYAWIDLERAVARATVSIRRDEIQVTADTREDMTGAAHFLETCLRGMVEFVGEESAEAAVSGREETHRPESVAPGTAFFNRVLEHWPDSLSPLLDDRTPREAVKSRAGRQQVAGVLLGLEREFARLRRLGRAWVDLTTLRKQLDLPSGASSAPRQKRP